MLFEELRLVAKPGARVIALGRDVSVFLQKHGLAPNAASVLHYSPLAAAARNAGVKGREKEYQDFSGRFSMSDVVDVATEVMREQGVPAWLWEQTLTRIRAATMSESRKKLAFIYSTAFTGLLAD